MAAEWTQLYYPPDVYSDYKKLSLQDRWPTTASEEAAIVDTLNTAVSYIEKWQKNAHALDACDILVHCNLGISRSTSVVIQYLQGYNYQSYDEALAFIRVQRPLATPHEAFAQILKHKDALREIIEL